MFNIGGGEFLVIALIALIVLGPQRLPDAARQVGKAMGELRRLSSGFQSELKDAFAESESAASTAPRRDALSEPAPQAPSVTKAVDAVSGRAPVRRTPLRAAPVEPGGARAAAPASEPGRAAARSASPAKRAPAAPNAPQPRTKGP